MRNDKLKFTFVLLLLLSSLTIGNSPIVPMLHYWNAAAGGGTTISFVTSASAGASSTSITVNASALSGLQDNDLMVALVGHNVQEASTSQPSGWTAIGTFVSSTTSTKSAELWYKVASSESGDYTWSFSTSNKTALTIAVYRGGFDTADPIDVSSNIDYYTLDTTLRGGTITVSANDSPLILVGLVYTTAEITSSAPSSPGTFAEDVDTWETSGDHTRVFYSQTVNSGATGNADATLSGSVSSKHAFLFSLNPD